MWWCWCGARCPGVHLHLDAVGSRTAHDEQVLGGHIQLESVGPAEDHLEAAVDPGRVVDLDKHFGGEL